MTKTERVQISLHAQNLKNVAGAFKGTSDPYAVLTLVASEPGVKPRILGKTEVIKNNLSPHWVAKFEVDYDFSKSTRFNVGIYDEVKKSENKSMGNAMFEIGEVLGARGNIKVKKLKKGGTIFCRIEKAAAADSGTFHFQLNGFKLKNVDGMLGKSDPFFEVSKLVNVAGGPTWQIAYRSETIKNDLNPKWKSVSVPLNQICGDNKDEKVVITVKDWEKSGKHKLMGSVETSVNGMIHKAKSGAGFELKKKNKLFGSIVVVSARVEGEKNNSAPSAAVGAAPVAAESTSANEPTAPITPVSVPAVAATTPFIPPPSRPSFIDYLSGGLELQLSVAIDFTGSNGDPRKEGTLHYIDRYGGQLNSYEKALTSVGSVIAKYDHDQRFQMLGFGAKYGGVVQHCFQLGPTPEVQGVKGMIEAYRNTFKSGLIMSGPTVFADVIQTAASQARKKQEGLKRFGQQAYHILLILTDGAVSDIARTKQALAAASSAPLSIVIVGMGSADFSSMKFLDDFANQEGIRDICQFVDFSRHQYNKMDLTQATLDEIPDQVVDYFYSSEIMPLPAVHGSQLNLVADEYDEEEIELDLNFNEDGEITLGSGGVYDETGFGNYNTVADVTPVTPPQATVPQTYQPAQPYNPTLLPQQGYAPTQQQPPAQPYNPASAPQQAYPTQQQPIAQPYNPASAPQQAYAPVQPQQTQQAYAPVQPQQTQQAYAPVQPQQSQQAYAPVQPQPPQQQVFHVQVPVGVSPGQQLQLQHPQTGQPMLVAVPAGVAPGGTFPVAY